MRSAMMPNMVVDWPWQQQSGRSVSQPAKEQEADICRESSDQAPGIRQSTWKRMGGVVQGVLFGLI